MKAWITLVVLFVFASSAHAGNDAPEPYPHETAEMLLIGSSAVLGLLNVTGLVTHRPSYLVGGASIASGAVALGLMAGENPRYEKGLFFTGVFASVTGLITVLERHEMNLAAVSVVLAFTDESPGLALVLDF